VNRAIHQAPLVLTIIALAACSGAGTNQSVVPGAALAEYAGGEVPFVTVNPVRQLCPDTGTPERMQCFALLRTDVMPVPISQPVAQGGENAEPPCQFSPGYCPIDLQEAYDLPSLHAGIGKTVAIVDAYGYHHAESDLAYFRKTMGLKACSTQTKCLRIVNQEGHSSPLPPESGTGWLGEESLDLDMVSGICPNCKIILVEANDDFTNNLYASVKTAGSLGPKFIGVSWGAGPEGSDNSIFHQPGVLITAAAGDNGGGGPHGGPIQPCTYTYVVCVGGTHLVRSHTARGWSETVWNDFSHDSCSGTCGATGSACSKKIAKPSWQTDQGCHMRSAADISATASVTAPVIVYNSELGCSPPVCFFLFGGTSASTQIMAGVYALAGNAAAQMGGTYLWHHHGGHVYDVIHGNNIDPGIGVTCASTVTYICNARVGFDGPTGWGTPKGVGAF
jgi:subtilase family serine protease